jgi:hypothetical protein
MSPSWAGVKEVTSVLVDVTLLLGAVAAVFKFRLFNLLGHRWHSTLECAHYELPDRSIVFTADYTVTNRGQRPLRLRAVSLRIVRARRDGPLLLADETQPLAERTIRPSDTGMRGNLQIEAGERTIFTIRAVLAELPDVVFVLCALDPVAKRPFTTYRGFYSRWRPTRRVTRRSGAQPSGSDSAEAAGDAEDS